MVSMAEQKPEQKEKPPGAPKPGVIILKDKQARIILSLKSNDREWYISSLAKATGTTYVHACNFLTACDSMGITASERRGKLKVVKLTEKGSKIADLIDSMYGMMAQQKKEQEPEKKAKEPEKKDEK